MDLRDATTEDQEAIETIARESMHASYGHVLAEDVLDAAIDQWYDDESIGERLADDEMIFVVAVDEGDVVGFAEGAITERQAVVGEIDWLHITPEHRGGGLGADLLTRLEIELLDRGVTAIEGRVLVENETGTSFYEREGFSESGERTVEIGGEGFRERQYRKEHEATDAVLTDELEIDAGEVVYVAYDESERGSKAPFYAAYADADREERYGWICGNCDGANVSMDTMGRFECGDCGNKRRPTRWDAAYL
ncbi:GNAT family N-acetyltransferase [Haloferacaceae archaeon DSL9]